MLLADALARLSPDDRDVIVLRSLREHGRGPSKDEKWLFSQKALGTRKITLDYKKGQATIALKGVDLGAYEKGSVPVRISIDFEGVHFEDTPDMASSGKALKY